MDRFSVLEKISWNRFYCFFVYYPSDVIETQNRGFAPGYQTLANRAQAAVDGRFSMNKLG